MRFSIGAISEYSRPMVRNEAASHLRRTEANRLHKADRCEIRPRICRYCEENRATTAEAAYLADTDQSLGVWTIERFGKVVSRCDNRINQVGLVPKALEEQIAVRGIRI